LAAGHRRTDAIAFGAAFLFRGMIAPDRRDTFTE
jgi:hypothetical protein